MKIFNAGGPVAFIADFDGTITELDVVDSLLARYAKGQEWVAAEREWADGKISSSDCLKRQLACVRISKAELDRFLKGVALDRGFFDLLGFLREEDVPFSVLSDGFDLLIRRIFELNGVKDVRFRANRLTWRAGRLVPSFPYKKHSCGHCAHCKRSTIGESRPAPEHLIFIGDGLSDICAASVSDTVYAKGKLADHCRRTKKDFVSYKNLREVVRDLPRLLKTVRRNIDHETGDERLSVKTR